MASSDSISKLRFLKNKIGQMLFGPVQLKVNLKPLAAGDLFMLITLLPILDALLPSLKNVVSSSVTNPIEKAALNALIDGVKSVADAYIASQATPVAA